MKKIKVGVIGTGFIGPVHVEAIRRQPEYRSDRVV